MKSRWMKWAVMALVVALLATGVLGALSKRKAKQAELALQTAQKARSEVELAASDVLPLQDHELTRSLPVSGSLRAERSAWIKARVPGVVQALTVREGDAVRKGQLIARIEPLEFEARLRQAREQADAARAQVDIAQRQYDNNKALVNQGYISQNSLDNSLANLNAARANHAAALAGVAVSRKSAADTRLSAPMRGLVSQRLVQPGERVGVDARIVEIVDLSRMEVEAALSAADVVSVRVGQQAQLQIEGIEQPVTAQVARINPSTQAGSRSVLVYLRLKPVPGLRQGLFVQGALRTDKFSGPAVPLDAVRTDKPRPYVQLVAQNQVSHATVTLGRRGIADGVEMVLIEGLAAGSEVLAGSVGPLREGTSVLRTASPQPHVQGR